MSFQCVAMFLLLLFAVKCESQFASTEVVNKTVDSETVEDVTSNGADLDILSEINEFNSLVISQQDAALNDTLFHPKDNETMARFNKNTENIFGIDQHIPHQTFAELKNSDLSNCGGVYSSKQTVIESPNYPNSYPKNTLCTYKFQTHMGRNCEFHLQFLDFELESSIACSKDRLQISNNVLCGRTIGIRKYTAQNGVLSLKFVSDDTVENRGFKILVTKLPCDDHSEETTTEEVIISTEDPDSEYENDVTTPTESATTTFVPQQLYPVYSTPSPTPDVKGTANISHTVYNSRQFNPQNPGFGFATPPLESCCANNFNQPRFYLASPGFPNSNRQTTSCSYYIYKSSQDICALRIKFKYFWTGEDSQFGCTNGYLQIDDRRLCGCKTGLSYETHWPAGQSKVIDFYNFGFPRTFYNGFVLDITQVPCLKRYTGNNIVVNKLNGTKVENFHEFEDKLNRVAFPELYHVDLRSARDTGSNGVAIPTSKGLENKLEAPLYEHKDFLARNYNNVIQSTDLHNVNQNPQAEYVNPFNIYKDLYRGTEDNVEIYYFEEPTYTRTETEAEFLERSEGYNSRFLLPNGHNENVCRLWGFIHWSLLAAESLWIRRPVCQSFIANNIIDQINPNKNNQMVYPNPNVNPIDNGNIQIINQIYGQFSSPNFPLQYPNNVNIVYRLQRVPGFCRVQVVFVEFDLEQSFNCAKDKLIIGNRLYCGTYLQNKYFIFNTALNPFYDIRFISDNFNSRRGFLATYEHSLC